MESATPKAEIVKRRTKKEASFFCRCVFTESSGAEHSPHFFMPLPDPAQSPRATTTTQRTTINFTTITTIININIITIKTIITIITILSTYYQDRTNGPHAHL
jgi:hypothetical protein